MILGAHPNLLSPSPFSPYQSRQKPSKQTILSRCLACLASYCLSVIAGKDGYRWLMLQLTPRSEAKGLFARGKPIRHIC